MNFLREDEPARGVAVSAAPGVRRITAANPGPMTYHGTNTYFLDWDGGVAVVDPGPDDAAHVAAIVAAAGAPIRAILLTHGHHDHWGALAGLRAATGATVSAFHAPAAAEIRPDVGLHDGETVGGWRALHTPGHAPDHLCFVRGDGVVLSGDHVMGWSTTVVGGPDGDMRAYFASLERVIGLEASVFLPGHGPALREPRAYAQALLEHRRMREAEIVRALGATPQRAAELVAAIYPQLDPSLARAAERNVVAHLGKLVADGRAATSPSGWIGRI